MTFTIDFEVKDSIVAYKGAAYAIGADTANFTSFYVSVGVKEKWIQTRQEDRIIVEPPTDKGWQISYLEKNGYREINSTKFQVHMTPRSSVEDWRRYTGFNYSCFWRYKGCKDARERLPTADPFPDDK